MGGDGWLLDVGWMEDGGEDGIWRKHGGKTWCDMAGRKVVRTTAMNSDNVRITHVARRNYLSAWVVLHCRAAATRDVFFNCQSKVWSRLLIALISFITDSINSIPTMSLKT